MKNSSVFLLLYLSSCQLDIETHKDSATLTSIEQTAYERHIATINACLKSGGGKEMSPKDLAAVQQALRHERRARGRAKEILPIAYGSICANYTSGTLESTQVRRCRYKLPIYPVAAIKYCIQDARVSGIIIEAQVNLACGRAKVAKTEIEEKPELLVKERQLNNLPDYVQLKNKNCGG